MTRTKDSYRKTLEAKRKELTRLNRRESIAIQTAPDAIDQVQLNGEREIALHNLNRESNLLRQVRAALVRMDEGTYGTCAHCEEKIKPKRLEAVPWAEYCLACQEAADHNKLGSVETLDELLASAA